LKTPFDSSLALSSAAYKPDDANIDVAVIAARTHVRSGRALRRRAASIGLERSRINRTLT
jgi:hypothetical protein